MNIATGRTAAIMLIHYEVKSVNPNSERTVVTKFWFILGVIQRYIAMKYFPSDATALKF